MFRERLRRAAAGSVLETQPGYRTAIGVLGIALPFVLGLASKLGFLETTDLENSISAYYWTGLRDWFVGTLFVIGVFLFFYQYHPQDPARAGATSRAVRTGAADAWLGKTAGLCALAVALFPTVPPQGGAPPVIGMVHGAAAAALFFVLALFPLLLFSQSETRRRVYQGYGWAMLVVLAVTALYTWGTSDRFKTSIADAKPLLILESLLIWLFGISWFDKGRELAAGTIRSVTRPVAREA